MSNLYEVSVFIQRSEGRCRLSKRLLKVLKSVDVCSVATFY
jgi:hypothetical protein